MRSTRPAASSPQDVLSSARPPESFRPDIEGLRGLAVLLVLAFHASVPGVRGGFVGVDVFFVLSGYLITSLLCREWSRSGRVSLLNFYARRARRILPASALVFLVTALAVRAFYAPMEQSGFAATARATALYSSNLWFGLRSVEYLAAPPHDDPFLHTWSLAVEEQFYLLWPIAILVALWIARRKRASRYLVVWIIASLAAGSFLLSMVWMRTAAWWAFFSPLARGWEFGIGALVSQFSAVRPVQLSRRSRELLILAGLTGIICASIFFSRTTLFPGIAALLPAVGTGLILAGGSGQDSDKGRASIVLAAKPIRYLGRVSYSWYLWHWPVLVLAVAITGPLSLAGRLGCLTLALIAAAATFKFVEEPVRYAWALALRPRLSVMLAAAITMGSFVAMVGWGRRVTVEQKQAGQYALVQAREDMPEPYRLGCVLPYADTSSLGCAFGDTASTIAVALFGDSHAAQWFPALARLSSDRHWKLIVLTKSGCPAPDVEVLSESLRRLFTECTIWRRNALERMTTLQPRVVILASSSGYIGAPDGTLLSMKIPEATWLAGLQRTLEQLSATGAYPVLIRDTPFPGIDIPACLARTRWRGMDTTGACSYAKATSLDSVASAAELATVHKVPRAIRLDMTDYICPDTSCPSVLRNTVTFRDSHHLTAHFSALLAPELGHDLDLAIRSRVLELIDREQHEIHAWVHDNRAITAKRGTERRSRSCQL